MTVQRHIAIIGAGPIGLEAALYAVQRGFRVTVFEQAHDVAAHVRDWGHVRMFSPFGRNSSEWGRGALRDAGQLLPADDDLLTGEEFAERYLVPLSRLPQLSEYIRAGMPVWRIGRRDSLKTERIGDPARAREPFRLALGSPLRHVEADVVLDCTGTYSQHNWLGAGGIPCPGEFEGLPANEVVHIQSSVAFGPSIEYRLPRIIGSPNSQYADCTTLVVGSGYSAATNVVALAMLQVDRPETRVIWATRRRGSAPIERIADDRLRERDRLAAQANELAVSGRPPVLWKPGRCIRRIGLTAGDGPDAVRWSVSLESDTREIETIEADHIIANVGYRPDRSLYEELQVHECYATQGPMKLAAKLLGETSADCLAQTSHGPETLRNPEPDFFILGAKSYGRNSNFVVQVGLQQIVDVFQLIERGGRG
jgi:threonine dehydrogenase-like Zn-dependent dehydrogenase